MAATADLLNVARRYAAELERLGVPVERIILFGSRARGEGREDSDIDLAVFSDAFGAPEHREFSGVLSEAKWETAPEIEAAGFPASVLEHPPELSFVAEILETGRVVYRREG